jgi:Protein of unknown function (DUF2985)
MNENDARSDFGSHPTEGPSAKGKESEPAVCAESSRTATTAEYSTDFVRASDSSRSDPALTGSEVATQSLDPPLSKVERYRDAILRALDLPIFQSIGIAVLLGVIIDGALFFFLLVGWHTLCTPRTDCEPRNRIYNISIQVLNGFFTYMAIVTLPWRVSNFLHLTQCSCPPRSNAIGCNLYGQLDSDLWFHIPVRRRLYITIILLLNCFFQFVNHATRFVKITYDEQDKAPGNIWTNVFFAAAFLSAGIGGVWIAVEAAALRKAQPGKFGHGPVDTVKHLYRHHFLRWLRCQPADVKSTDQVDDAGDHVVEISTNEEGGFEQAEIDFHHHAMLAATELERRNSLNDHTREGKHRSIFLEDRGAMRMFGM